MELLTTSGSGIWELQYYWKKASIVVCFCEKGRREPKYFVLYMKRKNPLYPRYQITYTTGIAIIHLPALRFASVFYLITL